MPHQCTGCRRTFADGSKQMLSGCPDCGGNKFQYMPRDQTNEPTASASDASPGTDGEPEDAPPKKGGSPEATSDSGDGAMTTLRDWIGRSGNTSADSGTVGNRTANLGGDNDEETAIAGGDTTATDEDTVIEDEKTGTDAEKTSANDGSVPMEDGSATRAGDEPDDAQIAHETGEEDRAQASARSGMIGPDELPSSTRTSTGSERQFDSSAGPDRSLSPASSDRSSVVETGSGSDTEDEFGSDAAGRDGGWSGKSGGQADLSELRAELNDQFESIRIIEPGQYELNLMELYEREEYIIELQENGRYVIQVPDYLNADE